MQKKPFNSKNHWKAYSWKSLKHHETKILHSFSEKLYNWAQFISIVFQNGIRTLSNQNKKLTQSLCLVSPVIGYFPHINE